MIYTILALICDVFVTVKEALCEAWQKYGPESGLSGDPSDLIFSSSGVFTYLGIILGVILGVYVIYYLFRSFGLYKMAKNRGLENPKLCFVPFYALFMASKLRSDCNAFKNHKPYPIIAVSAIGLYVLLSLVTDSVFSIKIMVDIASQGKITAEMFSGSAKAAGVLTDIMGIVRTVYIVLTAMIFFDIFRTYSPFRAKTHLVLSVIFNIILGTPLLYGIFVFSLRNANAVNYDEVLEKRRIYYGYGGGYNPYGNNNGGNDNAKTNDKAGDPFDDFSDKSGTNGTSDSSSDDPFADFGSDSSASSYNNGKKDDNGGNDDDSDSLF